MVAVDGSLLSANTATTWKKAFEEKGISLIGLNENPVDTVWGTDQPAAPCNPVTIQGVDRSGESHESKITKVREFIREKEAAALVVSMLDEVAWLLNIRGSDVAYNPVVISYAVVTLDRTYLFIDAAKVGPNVVDHLGSGVEVRPYDDIAGFLSSLAASGKVLVDTTQLNWRLVEAVGLAAVSVVNPITLSKAKKNDVELNGIRAAHVRDGAALTAFLCWLEQTVKAAPESITECDAMAKLEEFRGRVKDHRGPSFGTIAGYGPKGAIIHYHSEPATTSKIGVESMFLLDSGAQYLDGTTDVTRTMHFGVPSQHMKDCYTAVLKGHIGIATMVFPTGCSGTRFDCAARQALWSMGLDYNHGTGHGVGAYLNVHEGPQAVASRAGPRDQGFVAGMTISNEPGYYENGNFGIRIENICIAVKKDTPHRFNDRDYLGFETVTMVPIKTDLINLELLSDAEVRWINEYHATVRSSIEAEVRAHFPEALEFLWEETKPIARN